MGVPGQAEWMFSRRIVAWVAMLDPIQGAIQRWRVEVEAQAFACATASGRAEDTSVPRTELADCCLMEIDNSVIGLRVPMVKTHPPIMA